MHTLILERESQSQFASDERLFRVVRDHVVIRVISRDTRIQCPTAWHELERQAGIRPDRCERVSAITPVILVGGERHEFKGIPRRGTFLVIFPGRITGSGFSIGHAIH